MKSIMKILFSTFLLALVIWVVIPQSAEVQAFSSVDFLKTSGTSIRKANGTGDTVYLRGTNAGGWLVQESWMNPTNAGDQKTMMNTFTNRFGSQVRDDLIDVYEDNYWTTQDFDNCRDLGMSAIRLPFTYMNLTDDQGNLKSNAWERLDWFVENCGQRGIYVILDLHGTFGSQNGMDHSGEVNDGYKLYWDDYNRSKTIWLWQEIARHFNNNPTVAAYDILNEPGIKAGETYDLHWNLYNEIYNAIRSIDQNHIIIMESCWSPWNLPNPSTYGWTNIMYEYHHYPWDAVSSYDGQVTACNNFVNNVNNSGHGVPVLVGEFTCFDIEDAWKYTLSAFNNNGYHYTSWSYKATGNTSWGIYNHSPQSVDIYNDSADTIRNKWSTVSTQNGWVNSKIYNVLKSYLPGTVASGSSTSIANFADGEYYFTSVGNGKVVTADDYGNSVLSATRDSYGGAWESINIVNNGDGTVSFKSGANGLYVCAVLDESNQLLARSASVGTWEKFYIIKINNTDYAIQSAENGKYVQANLNDSGFLYASNDTIGGSWETFYINKVGSTAPVTTGPIEIFKDINYGGASIKFEIGSYSASQIQGFGFANNDLSSIKVPLGYKVTLFENDNFSGNSIVITSDTSWIGSDWNDKMSSIKVERAIYNVVSKHSNLSLDIDGWNSNDGANIIQWNTTTGVNQQWYLMEVNGSMQIISVMNGKALEVGGWSVDNGGNVQMWSSTQGNNQLWNFTNLGDGSWSIINVHSGKAMDVSDVSLNVLANIHQWDYVGGANQQWYLKLMN